MTEKTKLPASEIKRLYAAGDIDEKKCTKLLKEKGYTDEDIALTIAPIKKAKEKATAEPAKEGYKVYEIIDEDLKEKINSLRLDPALLYRINKKLGTKIVGEKSTRITLFLLALSHRTPYKQIVTVKGESSVGKNYLCDNSFVIYMPTVSRGRFSERAHEYSGFTGREIIYIQQQFGKATADTLKLLSTHDGGISIEITVQDPDTGEFSTITKFTPPATLVTTTIYIKLDREFETRSWSIVADDSTEQTERILDYSDDEERTHFEELVSGTARSEEETLILKTFVGSLPIVDEIIIPYKLGKYFPAKMIRARRDVSKFKDLVRLSAYAHVFQRPTFKSPNGKKCVIASLEDVYYAFTLGRKIIQGTLTGIDARVRDVGNYVKIFEDPVFVISQIQEIMKTAGEGKSRATIYYALKQMENEMMIIRTGNKIGRENEYRATALFNELLDWEFKSLEWSELEKDLKNTLDRISLADDRVLDKNSFIVYNPETGQEVALQ